MEPQRGLPDKSELKATRYKKIWKTTSERPQFGTCGLRYKPFEWQKQFCNEGGTAYRFLRPLQ